MCVYKYDFFYITPLNILLKTLKFKNSKKNTVF